MKILLTFLIKVNPVAMTIQKSEIKTLVPILVTSSIQMSLNDLEIGLFFFLRRRILKEWHFSIVLA